MRVYTVEWNRRRCQSGRCVKWVRGTFAFGTWRQCKLQLDPVKPIDERADGSGLYVLNSSIGKTQAKRQQIDGAAGKEAGKQNKTERKQK